MKLHHALVLSLCVAAPMAAPAAAQDERSGCDADLGMTGPFDGSHIGSAGDSGGDWDGDGKDDILTGGGWDSTPGTTDVFLYLGSGCNAHPCTNGTLELSPHLTLEGFSVLQGAGAPLSTKCAFIGDINGEGLDDIAVAEPYWSSATLTHAGRIFIYFAEDHQSDTTLGPSDADRIIEGRTAYSWFGYSFDGLDVTPGDDEGDLVVGAPGNPVSAPTFVGVAYVIEGADIMAASSPVIVTSLISVAYTGSAGSGFGHDVARVGDLDADGQDEFVVGAPQVEFNTSFVNPTAMCTGCKGFARVFDVDNTSTYLYEFTASNPASGVLKGYGYSVAGVKSVNGDSVRDIIVGAPYYSPFDTSLNVRVVIGAVYVYDGANGSLIHGPITPQEAGGQPDEDYIGAALGFAVDGMEDFDGDGKGDILASMPLYHDPQGGSGCEEVTNPNGDLLGRVHVYDGDDGATLHAIYRGQPGGGKPRLGFSAASGDINGDGSPDTYAGQLGWSEEPGADEEGRAFVFFSDPCCPPE